MGERAIRALERIAEHYPGREDLIFFVPRTDTVPAGTALTATFGLRRDFRTRISELYCDARADCRYFWTFGGTQYPFNGVSFAPARRVRGGDEVKIVLRVENFGAAAVEVGYYIKGWAERL